MSEFFKAELKDKFLGYASERDDYFEVQLLYDEFLRPNYSLQYVEKLIIEIIEHDPELLDVMSGNGVKIFMLSSTALTEDFLEEGGFTHLYVKEEEKWDTFLSQLSDNKKLSQQEKKSLGMAKKKVFKKERTLLKILISAVAVSFLFTLFSMVKSLFFQEDYVTNEELTRAISEFKSQNNKTNTEDSLFRDSSQGIILNDSLENVTDTVSTRDINVGQTP